MHAYLGQTDVQPLSNPLGGASDLKQCEHLIVNFRQTFVKFFGSLYWLGKRGQTP